jgi:heptosyltransferase-2
VKRILLIQTAFLGDVILATPVIAELKRLFPTAQIDVLVKKGNEGLLQNNPHLTAVYTFEKNKGKFSEIIRLIKLFKKSHYDLAINLHRFGSSGLLTIFSGAKERIGFSKNPFSFGYSKKFDHKIGDGTHEVERNLALIKEYGAVSIRRPELFPGQNHFDKIEKYCQEKFYCMAPASVWFTKQLPIEKWIELISLKANEGIIYLIGAPQDRMLCDSIIKQVKDKNVINLCGELNLLESAALISKSKRSFVNDSGPLHIASAMNAPVTAFFCSTIPDFGFGPLSEDATILQTKENLSCRPCGLHGHKECPEGHFKCGFGIEI